VTAEDPELVLVPTRDQAEWLTGSGVRSEPLRSFFSRLQAAWTPELREATPEESRMALVAVLREEGGFTGLRTLEAEMEHALSLGADLALPHGAETPRRRLLLRLLGAREAKLRAAGLISRSARLQRLAREVGARPWAELAQVIGAESLVLRHVFSCGGAEAEVFVALERRFSQGPGGFRVEVPIAGYDTFEDRDRDVFETVADGWARALDVAPALVDLGPAEEVFEAERWRDVQRVRVEHAADQAAVVAELVSKLVAEGTPLDAIAVALPTLRDETLDEIVRALAAVRIPTADPRGSPVLEARSVRLALELASQLTHSFEARAFAELLDSPFLDASMEGRRELRKYLLTASRLVDAPTFFGNLPASMKPDAAALGALFATHAVALRDAKRRCDALRALSRLWDAVGVHRASERGALPAFRSDGPFSVLGEADLAAVHRESRALRCLAETRLAFEGMARAMGVADAPATAGEVLHELAALLPRTLRLPRGAQAGALRIDTFGELVGLPFDALVAVDVSEAGFPLSSELPSALGLERERAAVHGAADMVAFYLVALAAPKRFFLAPRKLGEDTSPPSLLLGSGFAPRVVPRVTGAQASTRTRAFRTEREGRREAFFLDRTRPYDPLVGSVEAKHIDDAFRDPIAVTALERYGTCAFRGFAAHALKARASDEDEAILDARGEGNLLHGMLARVFVALRDALRERPRRREALRQQAALLLEDELAKAENPLKAIQIEQITLQVMGIVERAVDDDTWDFVLAEHGFGREEAWPGWPVMVDRRRVQLEGRIDRVDVSHDGTFARAVDYKRTPVDLSRLEDTSLQVPLYTKVAAAALGKQVGLGVYVAPQRDTAQKPEAFAESVRTLEARIGQILLPILAGDVTPRPKREQTCLHCDFSGGCRRPSFAVPADENE
jgi:hypothetical protein